MIHLVREYEQKIRQILYCRFVERQSQSELDQKDEIEVLIDFIDMVQNSKTQGEVFYTLNLSQLQLHYDFISDKYIRDTGFRDLTAILSNKIRKLIMTLIYEAEEIPSTSACCQILEAITKELKHFKTFILEKDYGQVLTTRPNHWHVQLQNGVVGPITQFVAPIDVFGAPDEITSVGFDLEALYKHSINNAQYRIERVLMTLGTANNEGYQLTNNGHFLYLGKNQESAIRSFLTYDNKGLIYKNQEHEWVSFLSGQSIPQPPLIWLRPKQHFILLIKHASYLKDQNATKPLPIELMGKQPSWIKLLPIIVFKDGKPLDNKDTFRSYESLKDLLNNTARYIKDLYSSYKGEE